jgi:hypothetical protein
MNGLAGDERDLTESTSSVEHAHSGLIAEAWTIF